MNRPETCVINGINYKSVDVPKHHGCKDCAGNWDPRRACSDFPPCYDYDTDTINAHWIYVEQKEKSKTCGEKANAQPISPQT